MRLAAAQHQRAHQPRAHASRRAGTNKAAMGLENPQMPELEDQPEPEPLPPSRNQQPRAIYNAEGDAQAALERYNQDFGDDAFHRFEQATRDGDQPEIYMRTGVS